MKKILLCCSVIWVFSTATFAKDGNISKQSDKIKTAEVGKKVVYSLPAVDICKLTVFANDRMQYTDTKGNRLGAISVPKVCKKFTVRLEYQGKLPNTVMGHNLILTEEQHIREISSLAVKQGVAKGYLPPLDDSRVLAASSKLIGGGANDYREDEIVVDMTRILPEKKYAFWCSFPGHVSMMKGSFKILEDSPVSTKKKTSSEITEKKG